MTDLETAHELVVEARRTGAWSPVLALLQRCWREAPSEDLADVLEGLTAEANRTLPRAQHATAAEFHRHWCAVARGEASLGPRVEAAWAQGWLASHLSHLLPRGEYQQETPASERCRLLETLGPDPRTAGAICAGWALGAGSPTHRAGQLASVTLLPLLLRMRDRRATAFVKARAATARGDPWFDAARIAEFDALPSRRAPEWRALLTSIDETELLARIAASPGDLALRRVLSDWLQEKGDPRGDFIALQLEPNGEKGTRRANALLKTHRRTWLGPLDDVLTGVRFERGFPVEATLKVSVAATPDALAPLALDPRLATLDTLWPGKSRPAPYFTFITSPVLAGLERIALTSLEALELLLRQARPLAASHLRFDENDFTEQHLKRLAKPLPGLRSVEVTAGTSSATEERLAARLKVGLGPRLRELHLATNHPPRVLRLWPELDLEALVALCPAGRCELRKGALFVSGELTARPDLLVGSLPNDVTVFLEAEVDEAQRELMEQKLARPVRVLNQR